MTFIQTVLAGLPSWDALWLFAWSVLVLGFLGTIQYVVTRVFGFTLRMRAVYTIEIIAAVLLAIWKIDYTFFQIGLPVVLFLTSYYVYYRWYREEDDVPELDLRQPPAAPPPESWPDDGPVFAWTAEQAVRHAEGRFRHETPRPYGPDGRLLPETQVGTTACRTL